MKKVKFLLPFFMVLILGISTAKSQDDEKGRVTLPTFSKNYLYAGEKLKSGEKLISTNKAYVLFMQNDGNLCVYKSNNGTLGAFVWGAYQTAQYSLGAGYYLTLQTDGNLCIYDLNNRFKWGSYQVKNYPLAAGYRLVLTDGGKLNILNSSGGVAWVN